MKLRLVVRTPRTQAARLREIVRALRRLWHLLEPGRGEVLVVTVERCRDRGEGT